MSDLTALQAWLSSLGPYGYVLAAAVPVLVYFLKKRFGPPVAPVVPTPDPTPANVSPRLDAVAPLLNALLSALGLAPKGRPATVADVPHDLFVQYGTEWDKVSAVKTAAAAQVARDLATDPSPAPAAK